ncbi:hypothetical protein Scep_009623 [Stephania cephalantha]|uniref:Uncharacterized protein n=1 Tax=Stephania cephalantha TaxID=152367 RepID=A0AAP0PDC1_9MAGN
MIHHRPQASDPQSWSSSSSHLYFVVLAPLLHLPSRLCSSSRLFSLVILHLHHFFCSFVCVTPLLPVVQTPLRRRVPHPRASAPWLSSRLCVVVFLTLAPLLPGRPLTPPLPSRAPLLPSCAALLPDRLRIPSS